MIPQRKAAAAWGTSCTMHHVLIVMNHYDKKGDVQQSNAVGPWPHTRWLASLHDTGLGVYKTTVASYWEEQDETVRQPTAYAVRLLEEGCLGCEARYYNNQDFEEILSRIFFEEKTMSQWNQSVYFSMNVYKLMFIWMYKKQHYHIT